MSPSDPLQRKRASPSEESANGISLRPRSVALALGLVAGGLVLASSAWRLAARMSSNPYVDRAALMFDVDLEGNFPAAFSSFLLLSAGLLLVVITLLEKQRASAHVRHWATLAVGFFFMSFDEAFEFHEKLIPVIREWLGWDSFGIFYFAWVIPGIALVALLGIYFAKFLAKLSASTRSTFMVAAALYLGGAIGAELIGGYLIDVQGPRSTAFKAMTTVEESLEMSGVIVFVWALLVYIKTNFREVTFKLQ